MSDNGSQKRRVTDDSTAAPGTSGQRHVASEETGPFSVHTEESNQPSQRRRRSKRQSSRSSRSERPSSHLNGENRIDRDAERMTPHHRRAHRRPKQPAVAASPVQYGESREGMYMPVTASQTITHVGQCPEIVAQGVPTPPGLEGSASCQGLPVSGIVNHEWCGPHFLSPALPPEPLVNVMPPTAEEMARRVQDFWPGGKPAVFADPVRHSLETRHQSRHSWKESRDRWIQQQENREIRLPPQLPLCRDSAEVECALPAICSTPPGIVGVEPYNCPKCRGRRGSRCGCRRLRLCRSQSQPSRPPTMAVKHLHRRRRRRRCGCRSQCHKCVDDPGRCDCGDPCSMPSCQFGDCVGDQLGNCFRQEPPPWPVPTSPLGFATCWDKQIELQQRAAKKRSCFGRGEPPPPPPPTTGGGFKAFLRDGLGLLALAAGEATEFVGDTIAATLGPLPETPEYAYPDVLYPDAADGQYPPRPPQPTKRTGFRWIDKANRLLDELLVERPPHPQYKDLTPRPGTTRTIKTGNVCIDAINETLDGVLAPPQPDLSQQIEEPPKPKSTFKQKLQCLLSCRHRCNYARWDCAGLKYQRICGDSPPPAPDMEPSVLEKLFPCLATDSEPPYQEKLGETLMPGFYGRSKYYCPHCDKNRYTGKRRCKWEAPRLRNPMQISRSSSPDPVDCVDFELF
eukprot:Gregarina_sp_Poly_1__3969@NODE_2198_length_2497_cov_5_283128_g1416_i0_p1_GENE_NODE_2198_length_2497_cov_5_283128_g1416_i0NODE_2198_length_2497_cov_5_283128_g1416_i0_p1_ORF_typecomplete_len681_score77_52_NODE_2198_length_2497_cov_5_283128_g1416_i02002242